MRRCECDGCFDNDIVELRRILGRRARSANAVVPHLPIALGFTNADRKPNQVVDGDVGLGMIGAQIDSGGATSGDAEFSCQLPGAGWVQDRRQRIRVLVLSSSGTRHGSQRAVIERIGRI